MYSPSIRFVCKLDILRKPPRHLIQTARVSPPEATLLSRSQRQNRRPSTRCRTVSSRIAAHTQSRVLPSPARGAPPPSPPILSRASSFPRQGRQKVASSPRRIALPTLPPLSSRRRATRRSTVRRDVHGRLSTEERRIESFSLGCGAEDPKPNPRSRGGSGSSSCRSWWRPWCWVITAAPFTRAWRSANDDTPGDDTIYRGWVHRWRS
jgi:hypothetical protein